MRCGSCNQFVSFDTDQEPETDDVSIDETGHVTGSIRIVNACAQCGDELKEASIDLESEEPTQEIKDQVKDHLEKELPEGKDHELELSVDSAERTSRTEGSGRGMRTFYGASISYSVTCSCDDDFSAKGEVSAEVQASSMEEIS